MNTNFSWKSVIIVVIYFTVCSGVAYEIISKVDFVKMNANDIIMIVDKFMIWFGGSIAGIFGYKFFQSKGTKDGDGK